MKSFCWILVGTVLLAEMGISAADWGRAQPGDAEAGKRLFRTWTTTGLTCRLCHADFNEKRDSDGLVRPGHSLFNSAYRTAFHTWDRKELNNLEDAISVCMVRWMTERLEENTGTNPATHHVRQLAAYLKSENLVQEQKAKPIEPMWTDKIPSDRQLKGGEANLGGRVFRRSCALCHNSDGSGPGPSLVRNGYSRYQIAKKIRGIDNKGLDGLVMPSFPQDRLSDRELLNAVEFVYQM